MASRAGLRIYTKRAGEERPKGTLDPGGLLVDRGFWVFAAPAREPRSQQG